MCLVYNFNNYTEYIQIYMKIFKGCNFHGLVFKSNHLQNFHSQNFLLAKFNLHQFESKIHVNGYILYLQEFMASFNLTSFTHWRLLNTGHSLIGVNYSFKFILYDHDNGLWYIPGQFQYLKHGLLDRTLLEAIHNTLTISHVQHA